MSENRSGPATPRDRALVLVVVASVALAGVGAFAVGGSSATLAGGPTELSPVSGKEVTPDNATANETVCPPEEDTDVDNGTENATANESEGSGYQLAINYTGDWRGTIVTESSDISINGSGSETIDIEADEDARVAASVSKTDISNDTLDIRLLLNGEVIDERLSAEPDVDNFDDTDDSSTVGETSADSTFDSASDTSTTTESEDGDWETFGGENESDAFEDSEDSDTSTTGDPFAEDTASTEEDPFASNNTTNATATALDDGNDTNDTAVPEECEPVEDEEVNTTQPTNDTDTDAETTNASAFPATTSGSAQVVFAEQEVADNGTKVVVESATLPDGGFVVIHNMSMMDGDVRESMIGVSEKLDAEQSEDIEINLADRIEESQTLYAVLYRDTDDDGEFEYEGAGATTDQPYLNDSRSAIFDDAEVRVPGGNDTEQADANTFESENDSTATSADEGAVFADTATVTETPNATDDESTASSESGTEAAPAVSPSTAMSGNAAEGTTETNAPGFGMGVAIVALLGLALLATRRN